MTEQRTPPSLADILRTWQDASDQCIQCGGCAPRCELLEPQDITLGGIAARGLDLLRKTGYFSSADQADHALPQTLSPVVQTEMNESRDFYALQRRCCLCSHCTAECPGNVSASAVMKGWRHLFALAGLLDPADSKSVMVDNRWHIFSVYRKVYGIEYPEFPALETVGSGRVSTLFFPGCSLVSYAPELTRSVCGWLKKQSISFALTDSCCGSPLSSAGLRERADALKQSLRERIRAAGIERVITVCAGCGEELRAALGGDIPIVPLPQLLMKAGVTLSPPKSMAVPTPVALFDSCHDRDGGHGEALRILTGALPRVELPHHGMDTLCCGAGGAVAAFDPGLCTKRVERVLAECLQAGAAALISSCPTCTYTFAAALLNGVSSAGLESRHYLELLFDCPLDWRRIFANLQDMWEGEHGAWVCEQLL